MKKEPQKKFSLTFRGELEVDSRWILGAIVITIVLLVYGFHPAIIDLVAKFLAR